MLFRRSFSSTSSAKFNKFDARNVILFQIKLLVRNIKETMLARYFIKVTTRPSFTRFRVTRRINIEFIKYQNRKCVTKIVSPSYLNFLAVLESPFNKATVLLTSNFIEKRPRHWCFPVNIANFFRTPILKNICERLHSFLESNFTKLLKTFS